MGLVAAGVVMIAFLIRVFPYLASGVPYHTDTYPQLVNVRNLIVHSPVPLIPAGGFDTYNIFWPADTLYYAASSVFLGVAPVRGLPLLAPLVTSIMALLFLALMRSFGFRPWPSMVASLLVAVAGGTIMISTGVTKEGFALPLMLLVLLLVNLWLRRGSKVGLALAVPSFVALLASHSLTSLMGLFLIGFLVAANAVGGGLSRDQIGVSIILLGAMSVLAYLYFYVYAVSRLPYNLQPSDVIAAFAYEVLFTMPIWMAVSLRLDARRWASIWLGMSTLGLAALYLAATAYHPLVDSPYFSLTQLLLFAPYLVVAGLAVFWLGLRGPPAMSAGTAFAVLWVLGLFGLIAFSIFATPGAIGTTQRMADFVYPGAAILASSVIVVTGKAGRAVKVLSYLVVGGLVLVSAYVVPYSAFWSGPLGGSQRAYAPADVSAALWSANVPPGQSVYGDARLSFMTSYFGGAVVDGGGGFLFLVGVQGLGKGCLFVSGLMREIGFIGPTYGLPVDQALVSGLSSRTPLEVTYSNGLQAAYCSG